jgi:hypothetical protein
MRTTHLTPLCAYRRALPASPLRPQIGPDAPCESADFGSCVSRVTPVFIGAGGNLRALIGCDKAGVAARLAPRVQCKGTKPTAAQLASQLSG